MFYNICLQSKIAKVHATVKKTKLVGICQFREKIKTKDRQ